MYIFDKHARSVTRKEHAEQLLVDLFLNTGKVAGVENDVKEDSMDASGSVCAGAGGGWVGGGGWKERETLDSKQLR